MNTSGIYHGRKNGNIRGRRCNCKYSQHLSRYEFMNVRIGLD